jgi:hypothetical protein
MNRSLDWSRLRIPLRRGDIKDQRKYKKYINHEQAILG